MSAAYTQALNLTSLARRLRKSRPKTAAPPSVKLRANMRRADEIAACEAGASALHTLAQLADTVGLARRHVEALEGLEERLTSPLPLVTGYSRREIAEAIKLHTAQIRAALRAIEGAAPVKNPSDSTT